MKIKAIEFTHPKQKLSNEDVIEHIRLNSSKTFNGNLESTLRLIQSKLDSIGAKTRYWMGKESVLDLMCEATEKAIKKANLEKQDIDLLIYTGIGRGFLEPGDSHFIAQALGMNDVDCFDITDACYAWSRACEIVNSFFKTGAYESALIVSAESYFDDGGLSYPSNFTLKSNLDIAYCFGAYCGGDGAAATVLVKDDSKEWEWHKSTTKEGVDLCTVPLPGYKNRSLPSKNIGINGTHAFTAFGSQVFSYHQYMTNILKSLSGYKDEIRHVFAHTGGDIYGYEKWAKAADFGGKVRYIFSDFGNLGTVSIPAAVYRYVENNQVQRGDRLAAWIGSSGMTFSAYTFEF